MLLALPERELHTTSPDQSPFEHNVLKSMGYWSCHYGTAEFLDTHAKHHDGHSKGLTIHTRAQTSTGVKHWAAHYTISKKHLEIQKALVLLTWNPVFSSALVKENL